MENAKITDSNATFWVSFKQCEEEEEEEEAIIDFPSCIFLFTLQAQFYPWIIHSRPSNRRLWVCEMPKYSTLIWLNFETIELLNV